MPTDLIYTFNRLFSNSQTRSLFKITSMRKSATIIFCFFLLISCKPPKKETIGILKDTASFPVLVDTLGIERYLEAFENPIGLSTSNYGFYFIGEVKDTVFLNPRINFSTSTHAAILESSGNEQSEANLAEHGNKFNKYYQLEERKNYKNWKQAKIDIQIDTLNKIASLIPVLLSNREEDTICIGYGRHIPLIMEATDSLGNWMPIQEMYFYRCGMGVGSVILPPNESVLTFAPNFVGNFKTKLRLKLGNHRSKPFWGSINYQQFQKLY